MRKLCLAAALSACLAIPSSGSADAVVGAGVIDSDSAAGANINLTAALTLGASGPYGLLTFSFPLVAGNNSIAGAATVECLRVEGNRASLITKSLNGPNSHGNQTLWIEDHGPLGLFGRDRVERQSFPHGDFSVCPPVTPPGGFQHELPTGDFTVIDLP